MLVLFLTRANVTSSQKFELVALSLSRAPVCAAVNRIAARMHPLQMLVNAAA
jgi:hypothetical protein